MNILNHLFACLHMFMFPLSVGKIFHVDTFLIYLSFPLRNAASFMVTFLSAT